MLMGLNPHPKSLPKIKRPVLKNPFSWLSGKATLGKFFYVSDVGHFKTSLLKIMVLAVLNLICVC